MREIKFKIYFEDEEPFMSEPISLVDLLHEDWIEFENKDNTLSLPLKDFRFYYQPNKNYKIMQYTGLKDKNGTEIYEGDIVSIEIMEGEKETAKVEYSENYAQYVITSTGIVYLEHEPLCDFIDRGIEVIGNIYDNPELLKGEENG